MSRKFPVEIWRQLTGSQIRLLDELTLVAHDRWAYMSRDYLSRKCKLTVNHISHLTTQLKELGVIEKWQPKKRRPDGTWKCGPCYYRVAGWIVWKLRGLFNRIFKKPAGLRGLVSRTLEEKKISSPDLSFLKNKGKRQALERFAELGKILQQKK